MTVAMIREASRILDEFHIGDKEIVTLIELGSEGAIMRIENHAWAIPDRETWMIARDGSSQRKPRGTNG
jgi:hypothetical protein